jgi:hypothetical protein
MNQLTTLAAAAALSVSVLSAAALPAAAQTDAPCPMLSDAALSEALGVPAHAQDALSTAPVVSCVLAASGVEIWLTREPTPPELAGLAGTSNAAGAVDQVQPLPSALGVSVTKISGLGDSALLTSDPSDKQNPSASLMVFSGPDEYSLTSWGMSDPQIGLPAVARAVLASH